MSVLSVVSLHLPVVTVPVVYEKVFSVPEPTWYLMVVLLSSISSEKSREMVMVSPCFACVVLVLLVANDGLATVGAVSSMPVICPEPTYTAVKFALVSLKQRYLVLSDSFVTVTVAALLVRVSEVPPDP